MIVWGRGYIINDHRAPKVVSFPDLESRATMLWSRVVVIVLVASVPSVLHAGATREKKDGKLVYTNLSNELRGCSYKLATKL